MRTKNSQDRQKRSLRTTSPTESHPDTTNAFDNYLRAELAYLRQETRANLRIQKRPFGQLKRPTWKKREINKRNRWASGLKKDKQSQAGGLIDRWKLPTFVCGRHADASTGEIRETLYCLGTKQRRNLIRSISPGYSLSLAKASDL